MRFLKSRLAGAAAIAVVTTLMIVPVGSAAATPGYRCAGTPQQKEQRMPVLLVHGFNSSSDAWDDTTQQYLANTPGSCIALFDYRTSATRWVTDAQIAPRLALSIKNLADSSKFGQIIIVGHSMGGLAARCALDTECSGTPDVARRVRGIVTLDTPHKGTFWKANGLSLGSPILGAAVGIECATSIPVAKLASGVCGDLRALLTSDAAHAFTPGSGELTRLPRFPTDVPVLALAGSIEVRSSIFGYLGTRAGDTGDLVVSEESALDESAIIDGAGGKKVIPCGALDVTFPVPSEKTCWHGTETSDPQFLTEILKFAAKLIPKPAADTKIINLRPVMNQRAATGWTTTDESAQLLVDCTIPSRSAVSDGIMECAPTAASAGACWTAPEGFVLCIRDPWRKTLALIPATTTSPTTKPQNPEPLALGLADGSRCTLRLGGSWPGRPEGPAYNGSYRCRDQPFTAIWGQIDKSASTWTVHLGQETGPLRVVDVSEAFFAG